MVEQLKSHCKKCSVSYFHMYKEDPLKVYFGFAHYPSHFNHRNNNICLTQKALQLCVFSVEFRNILFEQTEVGDALNCIVTSFQIRELCSR